MATSRTWPLADVQHLQARAVLEDDLAVADARDT